MDMEKVLGQLDERYTRGNQEGIEEFLLNNLESAKAEWNAGAALQLLNEMIGFYRHRKEYEKAKLYIGEAFEMVEELRAAGTEHEATTMLNAATTYIEAGEPQAALEFYQRAEEIYLETIGEDDYRFAALYNNMSRIFTERGEYGLANEQLLKAMSILKKAEDTKLEQAVTHLNIAANDRRAGREEAMKEHLQRAISMLEAMDNADGEGHSEPLIREYLDVGRKMLQKNR